MAEGTGDRPKGKRRAKRSEWGGEAVRRLRRHLDQTQAELADEIGVRQQTVSEWETGLYRPRGASATLLHMIAERADFPYRAGPPGSDGGGSGTEGSGGRPDRPTGAADAGIGPPADGP
jgi:DNA-binding transcriptional regulator YiaG